MTADKIRVDAVARTHGEPVSFLKADWVSISTQFKDKLGADTHNSAELPSQSYFESSEEQQHDGVMEAEKLAHVVSVAEELMQTPSKPEPPGSSGLTSTQHSPSRRRNGTSRLCWPTRENSERDAARSPLVR